MNNNFDLRILIKGKKSVLGNIMAIFVATIMIILILILFIVVSGFFNTGNQWDGIRVDFDSDLGVRTLDYMENFQKLTEIRVLLKQGNKLNEAVEKVKYEIK